MSVELMPKTVLRTTLIPVITIVISGCISPTPYQDLNKSSPQWGYAEKQIANDMYRVIFAGNPLTPFQDVYVYSVYRSAEIAQANNAPYFEILDGMVDKDLLDKAASKTISSLETPYSVYDWRVVKIPSNFYELSSYENRDDANSYTNNRRQYMLKTSGTGVTYIPMYSGPAPQPVVASLLIKLLQQEPADTSRVFVTKDVLAKLSPIIKRPSKE